VDAPARSTIDELVRLFKLLGDDTRLRILSFLQQTEELNVRQFCELLGQRQPSVSHHLALLRGAGLIDLRRDGKHNFSRLMPDRLEQLITLSFGSSPGQHARICFDGFELRYAPTPSAPERNAVESHVAAPAVPCA
jgi:ArsR family transcriptional regulator